MTITPAEPQPARTAGDLNNLSPGDNGEPGTPVKDIASGIAEVPKLNAQDLPADHPEREKLLAIQLERDLKELDAENTAGSGDEVGWEEAKENREAALRDADESDVIKVDVVDPAVAPFPVQDGGDVDAEASPSE